MFQLLQFADPAVALHCEHGCMVITSHVRMLQSYACKIVASCPESEVLRYDAVCVCLCVRACELQGVIVIGVPLDILDHAFNLAGW